MARRPGYLHAGWVFGGTAVLLAAIVITLFIAPLGRVTQLVGLVTGIIWPVAIIIGLILFWPQIASLMAEVGNRVTRGSSFGLGPLTIGELPAQAARIPSPARGESVTLENVALLHTSFLRPDKTSEKADGRLYYQIEVITIAPNDVMARIESVTYHLPEEWPENLRTRTSRSHGDRFKMKDLANGTTIVTADVQFNDGTDLLHLNRFIDLRSDGPRLT
jgi:hypothetical protein